MAILSIFHRRMPLLLQSTADPRHIQIMIMYNLYSYLNFEIVYCLMKTCTFSPRSTSNAKICARAYPRERNAPALCSFISFFPLPFFLSFFFLLFVACTRMHERSVSLVSEFFTNHRIPFVPLHSILGWYGGSASKLCVYIFKTNSKYLMNVTISSVFFFLFFALLFSHLLFAFLICSDKTESWLVGLLVQKICRFYYDLVPLSLN